jgi:hypothetical protein
MSLISIGLACLLWLPVSGAHMAQKPRLAQFTVPAGTALSIEVRTDLRSDDARASQQVTGQLKLPLFSGGLEVVPAGATVHGAVATVTAAGRSAPGRLEFEFHVIEHPDTGSRATIRTSVVTFEGERIRKKRIFGMSTVEMTEAEVEEGDVVSCSLLAPLLVFIPSET